jgi:hypothetical protein
MQDAATRELIWNHNRLVGGATLSYSNMQSIISASTTTIAQKQQAFSIQKDLNDLMSSLRENRIPPYSTTPRAVKRRKAIEHYLNT